MRNQSKFIAVFVLCALSVASALEAEHQGQNGFQVEVNADNTNPAQGNMDAAKQIEDLQAKLREYEGLNAGYYQRMQEYYEEILKLHGIMATKETETAQSLAELNSVIASLNVDLTSEREAYAALNTTHANVTDYLAGYKAACMEELDKLNSNMDTMLKVQETIRSDLKAKEARYGEQNQDLADAKDDAKRCEKELRDVKKKQDEKYSKLERETNVRIGTLEESIRSGNKVRLECMDDKEKATEKFNNALKAMKEVETELKTIKSTAGETMSLKYALNLDGWFNGIWIHHIQPCVTDVWMKIKPRMEESTLKTKDFLSASYVSASGVLFNAKSMLYDTYMTSCKPHLDKYIVGNYKTFVAPMVAQHITPLWNTHVTPLWKAHVTPLWKAHVTPFCENTMKPMCSRVWEVIVQYFSIVVDLHKQCWAYVVRSCDTFKNYLATNKYTKHSGLTIYYSILLMILHVLCCHCCCCCKRSCCKRSCCAKRCCRSHCTKKPEGCGECSKEKTEEMRKPVTQPVETNIDNAPKSSSATKDKEESVLKQRSAGKRKNKA